MITDNDIARVCAASYDPNAQFDVIWTGEDSGGIYAVLKNNILCFRGSVTADDWFRDLDAIPVIDPVLGGVHAGFAQGIQPLYAKIIQLLNKDTILCGHSLGAARALIFGGYMQSAGVTPQAIITFGSPLPGFFKLTEILIPVIQRSYRNRFDPVTDVPVPFPNAPYMHPSALIKIDAAPLPWDLDLLADHSISLYADGVPKTPI